MNSPFPGMDPYLEDAALWSAFQGLLVATLHEILWPSLGDRYHAVVGQRRYATASPGQEDYLEIRQTSDGHLATLLEIVSPANKSTPEGRQAYLDQRRQAKEAGASLVEIDQVLQGQPTLDYAREGLPEWDYAVTVTRSNQPERYEIYTAMLQKRLPRFRLPLAGTDRDSVLDLHACFTRVYATGSYGGKIDYCRDPAAPLSEDDFRWLDDLLVRQGLRGPPPSQEAIALAAYHLWEQEGRPHGRDREHWQQALTRLRHEARVEPKGG